MKTLSLGLIGLGGMGRAHATYLMRGEVPEVRLAAVCEAAPAGRDWAQATYGDKLQVFESAEALFAAKIVDAVLIATPHYTHPGLAIQAFNAGCHVLCEKPAGAYTRQVREMNAAAARSGRVFALMFQFRTRPVYQRLRELIAGGELGEIHRTRYTITNWMRTQAYYDSGGWRGTWSGEGGGVLLNQCPHNLDVWLWALGLRPKRVRAFCQFGKHHRIEVEDEVTAHVEFDNGATGLFATTTAEAPGVHRLEIAGERGCLVLDNDKLTFFRARTPLTQFLRESDKPFGTPETWTCDIPIENKPHGHALIAGNWAKAILQGTPLLAPGADGIHSLELANAMLLSTWTDDWVSFPIDDDLYHAKLQERIRHAASAKATDGVR